MKSVVKFHCHAVLKPGGKCVLKDRRPSTFPHLSQRVKRRYARRVWSLTVAFSRLAVADAWCLLVVWAPGFTHAAYAAQTWRTPSALGFKFAEKETRVVQGKEDMETLVEVENIEREAGRALISFFFPERRHPDGLV